jgi:hypothetical protein
VLNLPVVNQKEQRRPSLKAKTINQEQETPWRKMDDSVQRGWVNRMLICFVCKRASFDRVFTHDGYLFRIPNNSPGSAAIIETILASHFPIHICRAGAKTAPVWRSAPGLWDGTSALRSTEPTFELGDHLHNHDNALHRKLADRSFGGENETIGTIV